MRIVELSNHVGDMLRENASQRQAAAQRASSRYDRDLARHRAYVDTLRAQRAQARAQGRWLAWLRGIFTVWSAPGSAPRRPVQQPARSNEEAILTAGQAGEQMVAARLGRVLGDNWVLFHGYRNRRGEIDHLLLGPRGLFAIEVKHRNATVHIDGDAWQFEKYDRYGNPVERGWITDRRGRSPSVQLNEAATELERFLVSRGHPVRAQRVVLLTHQRSKLGTLRNLTVDLVATSCDHLIKRLNTAPSWTPALTTQLEDLIVRDHHFHERHQTR